MHDLMRAALEHAAALRANSGLANCDVQRRKSKLMSLVGPLPLLPWIGRVHRRRTGEKLLTDYIAETEVGKPAKAKRK